MVGRHSGPPSGRFISSPASSLLQVTGKKASPLSLRCGGPICAPVSLTSSDCVGLRWCCLQGGGWMGRSNSSSSSSSSSSNSRKISKT